MKLVLESPKKKIEVPEGKGTHRSEGSNKRLEYMNEKRKRNNYRKG